MSTTTATPRIIKTARCTETQTTTQTVRLSESSILTLDVEATYNDAGRAILFDLRKTYHGLPPEYAVNEVNALIPEHIEALVALLHQGGEPR